MEIFIARQPIYDRNQSVYGYELLYRNGNIHNSADKNGDRETLDVLVNSFFNFDIEELTYRKFCFINFTEKLLISGIPANFPPQQLVIEVLETISPSDEVVKACKNYKRLGYTIALDDFVLDEEHKHLLQLLPFIDIIKIDYPSTPAQAREKILRIKKVYPIKLLAEKVETERDYLEAYKEGFDLFQGYFFNKPMILSKREIPASFFSRMALINEIKRPEPDIFRITTIIENDLSLSYNILRMINKHFARKNKIQSIGQAIVLLGLKEIQRWIFILSLRESAEEQDEITKEVLHTSLVRAKFCEFFAKDTLKEEKGDPFFLTGMFSLIDTILHVPMEKIVADLPLQECVTEALLGRSNKQRNVLEIIIAIERADWDRISAFSSDFKIEENQIFSTYMKALRWANELVSEELTDDPRQ